MDRKLPTRQNAGRKDRNGLRGVQERAELFVALLGVLFIREPNPVAWIRFFPPPIATTIP